MSEYQYVAFRAVDRPVDETNLEYMRRQSTRAEITPWSFENEYHYGDFRGDPIQMLRRGYDIHLHYANFGIRKLLIRLPRGLAETLSFEPYLEEGSLEFLKDDQDSGGILCVDPVHEPGDLEELWEIDAFLDRLIPLRAEIIDGDLRPLYIAHLAVVCDYNHDPEEAREAPIPAGLEALSDAQHALAELCGVSDELLAAAAEKSPPMPLRIDLDADRMKWIRAQPEATKNAWLAALLAEPGSAARAEILAKYRTERGVPSWPTGKPTRTVAQLQAAATEIANESRQKAAEKAALERANRLAEMAAEPEATLRETQRLVAERTAEAYSRIADLLADLREALSGSKRADLAENHAQKLKAANPTLRLLTRELRRRGFVPK
jgi:hypothetical protein